MSRKVLENWELTNLGEIIVTKNNKSKQLKSTEYRKTGIFPVVDQSINLICGYSDEKRKAISSDLPIIIFGDHTRHTKFISFPFIAGADGTQLLKPAKGIDDKFFYYLVSFASKKIGNYGYDRHFKHLKDFQCLYPTDECEQQKIAAILTAIDRAIAHTEALIEKYQQIKAGLMHDLFTRGIGADGKLRPTREEAPELYQESAIGWIPREWELKPLEYGLSASPKNGYSPKEVENWQGVYVLGLSCLTKNGFSPAHLKNAPKTALRSSAKLEDGDFLISRSNTQELVGLCGIYRDIGHDTIYPDLMMKLRLNRNVVAEFLEQYLLSQATRQRISAIAVGTSGSMVKINATTLKSLKVVYPDPSEQKEIVNKLRPIMNHIRCLETQLNKLQKQKSGLMHDLLTGKVPVKVNPDEVDHISN